MQTELCVVLYPDHGFEPTYFTPQPSDSPYSEKLPILSFLVLGSRNVLNIVKTEIFLCCRLQQPALVLVGKKK